MGMLYTLRDMFCKCGANLWKLGRVTKEQIEMRCFYCGASKFLDGEGR